MAKRLIWTTEALNNRKEIFEYWTNRNQSKSYSSRLNKIFNEHIELVLKYPEIGMRTNNKDIFTKTVRDYQIIYLSLQNSIMILSIWDTRQDSNKLKYEGF
ncbi:type II toxin-antitoxin system RelE/ParE family toxin [Flavobacterium psychrotrophum]|uniref:type II toxin-antitoxin system RelE/ParE family toxin n=1 Tax=Flavobacterium psychrotrophum TaxID=2294119 RepID=UPI000E315793